jgi:hypothetical protein
MEYKLIEALGCLSDWEHIGGNTVAGQKKWKVIMQTTMDIPFSDKCQCGHSILKNEYIRNINDYADVRVMGSTCVKKFIKQEICCAECSEPHKEKLTNLCRHCGGWKHALCLTCGFKFKKELDHDCNEVDCCELCGVRYIDYHLCPNRKQACDKCFLKVLSDHECIDLLFTRVEGEPGEPFSGINFTDMLLGDALKKNPTYVKEYVNSDQLIYINKVLKHAIFRKGWVSPPKVECPDCLLRVNGSGHKCAGRLLWTVMPDGKYANKCLGNVLRFDIEYVKRYVNKTQGLYIIAILDSNMHMSFKYCDACTENYSGWHNCPVAFHYCGLCDTKNQGHHDCSKDLIECNNCFLWVERYHDCKSKYLDLIKKDGNYAGLTWKDILVNHPEYIWISTLNDSDLIEYCKEVLKSSIWKRNTDPVKQSVIYDNFLIKYNSITIN